MSASVQAFAVKGMSSPQDAGAIAEAIRRVDPQASPEVDVSAGRVVVQNDSAPADVLLEAFAAVGFEAEPAQD